jgi:hypothetical protein
MAKAVSLIAVLLLTGCVTTGGNFCDIAKPIRPSNVATLSDNDVAEMLAHNEKGQRLCGWRP